MTEDVKPDEQAPLLEPEVEAKAEAKEEKEGKDELPPIPRKHVTEIVKRERLEAFHKGKKAAMEELKAQEATQPQTLGGMKQMSPEEIRQIFSEEMTKVLTKTQEEQHEAAKQKQAQEIFNNFSTQMERGRKKYPDFEQKLAKLDLRGMTDLVELATETGMADDIMVDLAENPQKIANLMILSIRQPNLARYEMQTLADSIKTNQSAKEQMSGNAKPPLSQINPSAVGVDNGEMSVSDFRKIFI